MKATYLLAALPLLLAVPASAGTTVMPTEPVMTTTTDDGWEVTLGLYGWGAGLNGDLGVAGFYTPVDISFSDILDTLDMTAMGMVEVRKSQWLFQLEGLYLRNSLKGIVGYTPVRNNPLTAKLTAETTRLEAVGGYRLVDNGCTTLDVLAGVVYYDIANELNFYGPRAIRSAKSGDEWLDPIIGLRLRQQLSEHWCAQLRAEVGGFGVNADLVWQAVALLGYQVTDSSTAFIGWRHAAVDYSNGGFRYDVYSSGPILGLGITF